MAPTDRRGPEVTDPDGEVLDALGHPLLWVGDDDAVAACNDAAATALGRTPADVVGTALTDLFTGGADDAAAAVAVARDGGRDRFETALAGADGPTDRFEFETAQVDADVALLGRRLRARSVVERERQRMLDRMTDAYIALDEDWRVTHVNDAGRAVLVGAMDLPPDADLRGRHLWGSVPEAVDTEFYDRYHEAMERQQPQSFEAYYEGLDTWFEVRAYPSADGLSVYLHDVSERRHGREELEERQRVLREMYEVTADRDRAFDEKVRALLALGREQVDADYGNLSRISGDTYVLEVVDGVDDLVSEGDTVPLSATNCEVAAAEEQTLVLGDVERDAPDLAERAGNVDLGLGCYLGAPVFVDGEVYGTFCFYDQESRDSFSDWQVTLVDLMSRWVGYELEREQTTGRLRRQNERLEQFAGVVSHDLRNPLTVVLGSLENALAADELDDADLQRAIESAKRMNELIDDLLALSKAGESTDATERVDLAALAEGCWDGVQNEGATLRVETALSLRADESRLRQLLENLFRNAVEHGGDGVTVTVGDVDDGFYVADDGPGIPADEREQVFEHGFTTDPDGTGFGLAIVAEIAAAHGWSVACVESADGGARFEFTNLE